MSPIRTALALALGLATALPVAAQSRYEAAAPLVLEPGEFDWHPELAPTGPVLIVVSIQDQLAYVYRGDTLIGTTTVSTGKPGHSTPTGVFYILERKSMHYSNKYESPDGSAAPMPYMQRLTWDGVALHAGRVPGKPASHGCIRLPKEFARQLFDVTYRGTTVVVTDDASPGTIDLAGVPAEMAQLVLSKPWRTALPALMKAPVLVGAGGAARAD